jgi:hypothetical protein
MGEYVGQAQCSSLVRLPNERTARLNSSEPMPRREVRQLAAGLDPSLHGRLALRNVGRIDMLGGAGCRGRHVALP